MTAEATTQTGTANSATMIVDASSLADLLARWSAEPVIAIDTEADSLHSYREKLCLIQAAAAGENLLIDPLAGFSLQPLLDFLAERTIILHGANYDLRMLMSVGKFVPKSVFDTMLAARLTGRTAFSYAALVQEFEGIELPKASRKADWGQRPLTDQMIAYALSDTRYLTSIKTRLEDELAQLDRLDWLHQLCRREIDSALAPRIEADREAWRIKGAFRLDDRASAILRELWAWRDAEAARRDVPAFKVMRNEDLLDASEKSAALGSPVPPHYLRGGRLDAFLTAARRGLAVPEADLPERPKTERRPKTPGFDERVDALRKLRDAHARALRIEPSFIASRQVLEWLSGEPAQRAAALEHLLPWQFNLIRDAIPDLPK